MVPATAPGRGEGSYGSSGGSDVSQRPRSPVPRFPSLHKRLTVISSLWLRRRLQEFLVRASEGAGLSPTPSMPLGMSSNGEFSSPHYRGGLAFTDSGHRARRLGKWGLVGAAEF